MRIVTSRGEIIPLLGEIWPDIKDVAACLARKKRFNDHCSISVAQHSVLVSRLVPQQGNYPLQGLMHDAHEMITGDLSTPMKQALASIAEKRHTADQWEELEEAIACKVRRRWGLPERLSPCVREADRRAASMEIAYGFPERKARKAFDQLGYPADIGGAIDYENPEKPTGEIWPEDKARLLFLARFRVLAPSYIV